jgi:uncharacterized cupin superfamily protein
VDERIYIVAMTNLYEPEWDIEQDRPPFTWRRARLGRQAGTQELGASLFDVPPGASTFPLHVHFANEELLVVIAGTPTLRSSAGERELRPGDVVACPAGPDGAHRIDNRADEPARVLIVSTMNAPDVVLHPDSDKLWARDYAPGRDPSEGSLDVLIRPGERLDPLDGES